MSRKESVEITCDGEIGSTKCEQVGSKDSNHWLVGLSGIEGKYFVMAKNKDTLMNIIKAYDGSHMPIDTPDELVKDFCGEECAIKWVSKMLTEIKR